MTASQETNGSSSKPQGQLSARDSCSQTKMVSTVINCAFARSNQANDLASAIVFTQKLIEGFKVANVGSVINISSQGVYKRLPIGELSAEDSPIEPIDLYSMAKFAVEKIFETSGLANVTNVRLASINMKQRFLYHFVQKAKNHETIIHQQIEQPRRNG